jgi:predicted nucleotidyltransferase
MERAEILSVLKRNEGELRRRGVSRAALFGSVARSSASPSSDIDILLDIDAAFPNRETLKPHLRAEVERDALYAF